MKQLQPTNRIVQSLMHLKDELWEQAEFDATARMIVFKLNSCLHGTYPVNGQDELPLSGASGQENNDHLSGCPLAPYDPLSLQEIYTTSTKCACDFIRGIAIGEAVDDVVSKLREVGIVIEGSQAHLTHAILRSAIAQANLLLPTETAPS